MLASISGQGSGPKSRNQKLKGLIAEVKFLVGENPVRISRRRSMGMLQAPPAASAKRFASDASTGTCSGQVRGGLAPPLNPPMAASLQSARHACDAI